MTSAVPETPPAGEPPQVIPNWTPPKTPIAITTRETLAEARDTFERQVMVAAQNEPCRVTYGVDRLGAQIARVFGFGDSVLAVVFWGRGEIQSVTNFTVDDKIGPPFVSATHYTGTTSQAVNAQLVSACSALSPSVAHTATFAGLAYSVVTFAVGADIGDMAATITGRKIYDPRDGTQTLGTPSTYKWSDNPALALADLITNDVYGYGQAIDWSSVTAAANACDALVSGEKKRTVGITLDNRMRASEWLDILRAHAGCFIVRSGGVFKLVPDATASSVHTFTKSELVKGSVQWATRDIAQRPNVVEIRYTDTSAIPWQVRSAIYPANGVPPIGEELRLSRREMTGVQRYSQAIRECIEAINHCELESLTLRWESFLDTTPYEVGDVVTINDGGLTAGITFRILTREWARKGVWRFSGQKYDASAFDSSAVASPSTGDTTLPSPNSPPTPSGLTLVENIEPQGVGGVAFSSISASVTPVVWPFLSGYVWYVYDDAGNLVDEATTIAPTWRTRALPAPQRYTVFAKTRSASAIGASTAQQPITLSGSTQSLTQLVSTEVLSAGATYAYFEPYTLYQGDPYFRVAPYPYSGDLTFAQQFASDTISAASPNVLSHARWLFSPFRSWCYAKTAAVDLGTSKTITVSLSNAPPTTAKRCYGFEFADSIVGPWAFSLGAMAARVGRYVRLVVFVIDDFPLITFPDGTGGPLPPSWMAQGYEGTDLGNARINIFAPTVEETGVVTTSASGPVTVTLANTYAAMRDVQATALSAAGTAVVTVDNVTSTSFDVNATIAGTRVAIPVRWNFKGAL